MKTNKEKIQKLLARHCNVRYYNSDDPTDTNEHSFIKSIEETKFDALTVDLIRLLNEVYYEGMKDESDRADRSRVIRE